ncbi:MAG TPA: NUDIX domain-containing protein [Micromonosporaceae bacterium]|nr:NUDIX domain-containing protein [Micromonosporaceae bacterium]
MEQRRRIAAYGICRDDHRVLLVRYGTAELGVWQVPGGGLGHGEHPAAALVRVVREQAGLEVEATGVRAVVADVIQRPDLGIALHTDRVIYEMGVPDGRLRAGGVGAPAPVAWVPSGELSRLRLMPFTAELLGIPAVPLPPEALPSADLSPQAPPLPGAVPVPARVQGQRFAAYGLVTDPAGRVLLTQIADGYPGAGRWHLPGGGTDHGEQPVAALLRELVEESGQLGRVMHLLDVSHRHDPNAMGPEGYPIDWHVVRAIYRVVVDLPSEPTVTEAAGSTAQARWFTPAEVKALLLTGVAAAALG